MPDAIGPQIEAARRACAAWLRPSAVPAGPPPPGLLLRLLRWLGGRS